MIDTGTWPMKMQYLTCDEYNGKNTPKREIDLKSSFMKFSESATYGNFTFPTANRAFNGNSFIKFDMSLSKLEVKNGNINSSVSLANWSAGFNNTLLIVSNQTLKLKAAVVYRVYTVVVSLGNMSICASEFYKIIIIHQLYLYFSKRHL